MIGKSIIVIIIRAGTIECDVSNNCIEELVVSRIRCRSGIGGNFIGADINTRAHHSIFAVYITLPQIGGIIRVSCIMAWRTGCDVEIINKKRVNGYVAVKTGSVSRAVGNHVWVCPVIITGQIVPNIIKCYHV